MTDEHYFDAAGFDYEEVRWCERCNEEVTWSNANLHPSLGGHVVSTWHRLKDDE